MTPIGLHMVLGEGRGEERARLYSNRVVCMGPKELDAWSLSKPCQVLLCSCSPPLCIIFPPFLVGISGKPDYFVVCDWVAQDYGVSVLRN